MSSPAMDLSALPPPITSLLSNSPSARSNAVDYLPLAGVTPHEETEEIIRQVEFYFSDENLRGDAHLLSKTGEFGDGWVSLNEILGFKKMKRFKPPSRVKTSLHQSQKLEIWKNKRIRRKQPLTLPLTVTPKSDPNRERDKVLAERPWMTKGMLKPTGFENHATDGPVRPEEYEEEKKLFDPEESFVVRIENAVTRYTSRRKMHSSTSNIFTKFLIFGGFSAGQRQFVGGLSKQDLEQFDKDQIADMQARFAVSEAVLDGCDSDNHDATWIIDFEGMANAFLSSSFMASFLWTDQKTVSEATNILRNFYNYLLTHNVCPEYEAHILAARHVCSVAEEEFAKLARVDKEFPGAFNIACSMLHEGALASLRPIDSHAEWVLDTDAASVCDKDTWATFVTGVSAHCNTDQRKAVAAAAAIDTQLFTVSEEDIGLEVIGVEYATGEAKQVYGDVRIVDTFIEPTGKLYCKWWEALHRAPQDLPKAILEQRKAKRGICYEFVMEEKILRDCYIGLKFEAVVKELETGIKWIDSFTYVYPSFYTWTLNEAVRDWKEPGPPKAWQERQNAKKQVQDDVALTAQEEKRVNAELPDDDAEQQE